jgi:hypothetical protein
MFLWEEACRTTVYIQNMSPHTIQGKLTPVEVFTGTRPDVSHLRIFGSVSPKLDPIGEKGILVGYNEVSKAYCIFVPAHRRIVVCKDVQFEEEQALRRSRDMPTHVEDQHGHDCRVKNERLQVQSSGSQGQSQGTGDEREISG